MQKFLKQFVTLSATAVVSAALLVGAVGPASSAPQPAMAQAGRSVA